MKKVFTSLIIIISLLIIIAVGAGTYWVGLINGSSTNLPSLYAGGVYVGELTGDETMAKLTENGWKDKAEKQLHVSTLAGVSFDVDPISAGLAMSIEDMVSAAFNYGRGGDIADNIITAVRLQIKPVDILDSDTSINDEYIYSLIDKAAEDIRAAIGTDEYTVDIKSEELVLMKGSGELELDREGLYSAIVSALSASETELEYSALASPLTRPDFAAIHKELEKEPSDARYKDDGSFEVIDEVVGCRFDVSAAEKLWDEAQPAERIAVPLSVTWPEVTGESLRSQLYCDLLGACTTKFPNSAEARRNNLKLAASKIDGLILYPGDTFAYNEVVGERTEAAGFLPAPAYVDGDVKDEIGGGACQVSSTLYAATVFAFLETVEREAHVFPVNYMQMGTDATVTIPAEGRAIDFKFRNNRDYPIKLVGIFDNDESLITFEIWGTLEDDDYMPVEFDNSYGWQYDYDRAVEPAYPDRDGVKIRLDHETYTFEDDFGSGYRTLTHRIVYASDGSELLNEIINAKLSNGNYAMDTYYQHP